MKQKIIGLLLILGVMLLSLMIVILPTFFTKGLSRIELNQTLELPLVLDGKKPIEFIFFGYAGCLDVCTPRLHHLASWYTTLSPETQQKIGVRFFDLSIPASAEVPDTFAKTFNPDFKGVFLSKNVLRDYTREFSVYFADSLLKKDEMDHTAHLYLVKRDAQGKKLRFIYTAYPYDLKQIQSDIEELLDE